MQVVLHVQGGPVLRVLPGEFDVGRSPDCHIRLLQTAVSRRHCRLAVAPGRVTVRDLGSRNHTLLNSRRVADEQPLKEGDWLALCDTRFQVRLMPDGQPPDPGWLTVRPEGPGVTVDPPVEPRFHHPDAVPDVVIDANAVTVTPEREIRAGRYVLPLNIPGSDLSLHIDLRAKVGQGQFGTVWWAKTRGTCPDWHEGAVKIGHIRDGSVSAALCRSGALAVATLPPHPRALRPRLVGTFRGRPLVETPLAEHSLADLAGVLTRKDLAPRLLAAVRDAAAGLDHLHANGLVHGCPKPTDILFTKGRAAVADWDLVHHAHVAEGAKAVARYGDPNYLAPEVWAGWADGRSDQYALACGYAEVRTGRRPFTAFLREEWADCHRAAEPDLDGLSAGEREVIGRALSKDADQRFESCGELANELCSAAHGR